jgi:cell division protein FtsI/penicillin-binding protein 2
MTGRSNNHVHFSILRFRIITLLICAGFALVLAQAFRLQVVMGSGFVQDAQRQYVRSRDAWFDRGGIFFISRDGSRVSGATVTEGVRIAAQPSRIKNPDAFIEQLSSIVGEDADPIEWKRQLARTTDPYEILADRLTQQQVQAIADEPVPGITLERQSWRWYPGGTLAAHVVGFVGYKGDVVEGRYGLERQFETVLRRQAQDRYVNAFADLFGAIKKAVAPSDNQPGDIITTIEPHVQVVLERELESVRKEWDSDRTAGFIMDPKTGSIIAMAVTPGFDPNKYGSVTDPGVFQNPMIEHVYEVGSIMKPIVVSIALDENVLTPETTYYDAGSIKVGTKIINNFDKKGRGTVSMQEVLNQSLNTGMVFIQQRIPKTTYRDRLRGFGFGQKTGVDLPGELLGLTKNLDTLRDVEYANIAFGQGMAVTPIAMARAWASLANGGLLVTPHVVDSIDRSGLTTDHPKLPEPTRSISPEASAEITKMLTTVYDNYGEGKYAFPNYSVAGKTGTAQIAEAATGGYYADRNLHSFIGYFPASNPQFMIYLMNEYPKNGAQYASQTLLPTFKDLARFMISYYEIAPDR